MGLYVGNTRVAPVLRVNVVPNFKGLFNLLTDLLLHMGASETLITAALASAVNNPSRYDYCLVEKPWYQVYNGYSGFTTVDAYVGYYIKYYDTYTDYTLFTTTTEYVGYYVLIGTTYTLVTDDNKDSVELGIVPGTTTAYTDYRLIDDSNKSSSGITPRTTVAYILNNAYSVVRYNFDGTDWTSADNSGYANVDASNFTDSGTTFLSGLGMSSNRRQTLTVGASGSIYTAPANGWFYCYIPTGSSSTMQTIYMENIGKPCASTTAQNNWNALACTLPFQKGDRLRLYWSKASSVRVSLYFFYAEGTPTPPQP